MKSANKHDKRLIELFLEPVRKCAGYKPAFGQGSSKGLDLSGFNSLYGRDPFYAWIGLDDPLLYAAHKAAGGLTSVYRQIGVGSERLLRQIVMETLGLTSEQAAWRYHYSKEDQKQGVHILDAKISLADLHGGRKACFEGWIKKALSRVGGASKRAAPAGVAFEIRQGYKSADSKRQNADLRFGIRAYQERLLPVFVILSSQVSEPVVRRYRQDGMLVLTGLTGDDATVSTFAFFKEVVGYDLAGFFQRNSGSLRREIQSIVAKLLTPE